MTTALERAAQRLSRPGVHVVVLPIGSGTKGGDAIVIKYVLPPEPAAIVCIDAGRTEDDGRSVVRAVRESFGCEAIDIMIVTHSDDDHAAGVRHVLVELPVRELWANDPRISLTASAGTVIGLLDEARARGIWTRPALAGTRSDDGVVELVGPSADLYEELRPKLGDVADEHDSHGDVIVASAAAAEVDEWSTERLLGTPASTSPANTSSAITLLRLGDIACLFTGDCGVRALQSAAPLLAARRFEPTAAALVQIPHHGSKNNLDTPSADLLAGPVVPTGRKWSRGQAFASCPPDGSRAHPSLRVINAFVRRGFRTFTIASRPFHFTFGCYADDVPSNARRVKPADFAPELPGQH